VVLAIRFVPVTADGEHHRGAATGTLGNVDDA